MLAYLLEIRKRTIYVLSLFGIFFIVFFFLATDLFHAMMKPLLQALPVEDSLIAIQVTAPVFIPISLAADAAMLCTAPFALLHAWRFIAPALYQHEKQKIRFVILASMVLFACGVAFCFYGVLPFMFRFFAQAIPLGIKMMPDMANALEFITHMLLLFGLGFQVPLLCLTLVNLCWIDVGMLQKIRPYVIVSAFILGMLLTPPDVFSQITLALPLCLLYEVGIILAKFGVGTKVASSRVKRGIS